ncbi:MAG: hypothetical protein HOJ35_12965 [Bdellovibrionales bacterium]|nr:hypothetical protein [Bdellovibrionales bacterium]
MVINIKFYLLFLAIACSINIFAQDIPTSSDLTNLAGVIKDTNKSISDANDSVDKLVATGDKLAVTGNNINKTANSALDTYNTKLTPQIDSALEIGDRFASLGEGINPESLFVAGLATAAGGALGGFLMSTALSGIGKVIELITTDWDKVELDVYEANIFALHESHERLKKIESAHLKIVEAYKLIHNPAFETIRQMSQQERRQRLNTIINCRNDISDPQIQILSNLGDHLILFEKGEKELHSELCRYKTLMETTKLLIQEHVAKIQASYAKAQYGLREKMYKVFEKQTKAREEYLENRDIRLVRAKDKLYTCLSNGTPDLVKKWNDKYCVRKGPEICLTQRDWDRYHNTYNCIWNCVPPELEDIKGLSCPTKVPIPLLGPLFGKDSDCSNLNDEIQEKLNNNCITQKDSFPKIREIIAVEIEQLEIELENQKRETDIRIRILEHTIQQISPSISGDIPNEEESVKEYREFLYNICG